MARQIIYCKLCRSGDFEGVEHRCKTFVYDEDIKERITFCSCGNPIKNEGMIGGNNKRKCIFCLKKASRERDKRKKRKSLK